MTTHRTWVAARLLLAVVLASVAGCTQQGATPVAGPVSEPVSEPVAGPSVPSEPPAPAPAPGPIVDWGDPAVSVALENGWTLRDCEGDAPLRCFHAPDGTLAGTLEFDRMEGRLREAPGSGEAALRAIVAEFASWLVEDRSVGCPGHVTTVAPVELLSVDGRPALIRSHTLEDAGGGVTEQILAVYVADGDDLVLVSVTATEPGSCTASPELIELTPRQLAELAPTVLALIESSALPI